MRISLPRIDCETPIDLSFIERVSQEAVDMVGSDLVYGCVDSGLMVEGRVDCRIEGRMGEARQDGAVLTRDLHRLFRAIRRLNFGGLIVNDSPAFRADHMPYGGNRQSGLEREGVRFAMEEMTNLQMVAIRTVGG